MINKDSAWFFFFFHFTNFWLLLVTFAVLSTIVTDSKSTQIRSTLMATPLVSEQHSQATFTSKVTATSKLLATRTFSISTHVSANVSPTLQTSTEEPAIAVAVVGFYFFIIPLECNDCSFFLLAIVMCIQIANGFFFFFFFFLLFDSPQPLNIFYLFFFRA